MLDQHWWNFKNAQIEKSVLSWERGIERVHCPLPLTPELSATITARVSNSHLEEAFRAARAAAHQKDAKETQDLYEAKAVGRDRTKLTATQRAALARNRSRKLGIGAAVAAGFGLLAFFIWASTSDSESPQRRTSGCDTGNAAFVRQEAETSPGGGAAAALRAAGFLVSSDGAGGSCVFEDRPLGG